MLTGDDHPPKDSEARRASDAASATVDDESPADLPPDQSVTADQSGDPASAEELDDQAGEPETTIEGGDAPREEHVGYRDIYHSSWNLVQNIWQVIAITAMIMMVAGAIVNHFREAPKGDPLESGDSVGKSGQDVDTLVHSHADIAGIEDPIILDRAGRYWLQHDDAKLARECFVAALERDELARYTELVGSPYEGAVVLERMGEFKKARAAWRATFHDDVLSSYFFIHRLSQDPKKRELLEAARAYIDDLVAQAKAGGSPHFYTTKSGASRQLTLISQEEALAAFEAGEKVSYAFIESLDLSGKTFPAAVVCSRCVVGDLMAYGSTFEDELKFRGIVLGEAHLGKKWKGEVNKSGIVPPATFNRLYLDNSIFLGGLNLDSVQVTGRLANLPMVVVEGVGDLRDLSVQETAEFRFAVFTGQVNLKGAEFFGPTYFGNLIAGGLELTRVTADKQPLFFNSSVFNGPVLLEKCDLVRGATFENASFLSDLTMRNCRLYDRVNFSRVHVKGNLGFSHVQATDLDFLGGIVDGDTAITDSVFSGNVRFALDGLTRRQHLHDANPLHKLYKQYQGDVDAEEDLTSKSQYGVTDVNDLTSVLRGEVTFANTIFEKFVTFEGVSFGTPTEGGVASFYNAQLYGESHFERTRFYGVADFRTISGNEVSFDQAKFYGPWMLDGANAPGRLSVSGARFGVDADISMYGAEIASLDITMRQLEHSDGSHRLFYEQCARAGRRAYKDFINDPRMDAATWDDVREVEVTDEDEIADRTEALCYERTISEFVTLKEIFDDRSMSNETDWAYWNLRHYENRREFVEASSLGERIPIALEWLIFEKGFGWGVRLSNLLWTGLAVIIVFMGWFRMLCGDAIVVWDAENIELRCLPLHALAVVSLHSFLGTDRDWQARTSNKTFKLLYILELVIGIILVTFFIGAYTRMVLS